MKETNRVSGAPEEAYLEKVVELYKTRFHTLNEFTNLTQCFFKDDFPRDPEAGKKIDKYLKDENAKKALSEFKSSLQELKDFDTGSIEKACRSLAEKYNIKPASIIHPTRSAISGKTVGAGLFEMMELLGKEKVVVRLAKLL